MKFLVLFRSGDGRRMLERELEAADIDSAATKGIYITANGELGAGAAWHVVGVVQLDAIAEVGATLEGMV